MIPARRALLLALVTWPALAPAAQRSARARRQFLQFHPCPSTGRTTGRCPGYVIDHVRPLKRGGQDDPANMQWQTAGEARRKDRWE